MNTGFRPIRSDRVAQSGMANSATTLALIPTQSMTVELIPTSLVAYAKA